MAVCWFFFLFDIIWYCLPSYDRNDFISLLVFFGQLTEFSISLFYLLGQAWLFFSPSPSRLSPSVILFCISLIQGFFLSFLLCYSLPLDNLFWWFFSSHFMSVYTDRMDLSYSWSFFCFPFAYILYLAFNYCAAGWVAFI